MDDGKSVNDPFINPVFWVEMEFGKFEYKLYTFTTANPTS